MKIVAAALKEFPQFNASVDMESKEIIYKQYVHLGVAVDTDRGLLVPVIRDVDKKDIFTLTDELNAAAERARNKRTALDELAGGCLTLTNLGGIGGTSFTPIINWPEVAILGLSRASWEPVYNKEKNDFAARFLLPLSLSYDHRIIDGANGAYFIRYLVEAMKHPHFPELKGS
jgi:pyruvate dehydrogenase E2 component (dihydrolipoamide acetyltransferase)